MNFTYVLIACAIVTFGVVMSGLSKTDPRTKWEYLQCVFMWPLLLALGFLVGCYYAILAFSRIMWFAVNFIFGLTVRR